MMEIEVRLFATFRDYLPAGSDTFSCRRSLSADTAVSAIAQDLKLPEDMPKIFIVNGNVVTGDHVIHDGDVVSIFPPVAGG